MDDKILTEHEPVLKKMNKFCFLRAMFPTIYGKAIVESETTACSRTLPSSQLHNEFKQNCSKYLIYTFLHRMYSIRKSKVECNVQVWRAHWPRGDSHHSTLARPAGNSQECERDVSHLQPLQRPVRTSSHPWRHSGVPDSADTESQGRHWSTPWEVQGQFTRAANCLILSFYEKQYFV